MLKIVPVDVDLRALMDTFPSSMSVDNIMSAFVTFPTEVSANTILMLEALRTLPRTRYEALSAYQEDILSVAQQTIERSPQSLLLGLELIFNVSPTHFTFIVFSRLGSVPSIYDARALVNMTDNYEPTAFVINASGALAARNLRLIHPAALSSGWTNNTE